jgi:hypothetical protein
MTTGHYLHSSLAKIFLKSKVNNIDFIGYLRQKTLVGFYSNFRAEYEWKGSYSSCSAFTTSTKWMFSFIK